MQKLSPGCETPISVHHKAIFVEQDRVDLTIGRVFKEFLQAALLRHLKQQFMLGFLSFPKLWITGKESCRCARILSQVFSLKRCRASI